MLRMNWFRKSSTKSSFPWKELTSDDQFLDLFGQGKPFAIFKHSTRCSISSMAKNRLEGSWDLDDNTPIYYLDLIQYRNVSNLIADKLNVQHQSPQLIVFNGTDVVYHASHNAIHVDHVKESIATS